MKREVKKIYDCTYEVTLACQGEEWKEFLEKAYSKLEAKVSVPGFRKGKAPKEMLRSKVSTADAMDEAANMYLQGEFEKVIKENDFHLIEQPHVHLDKISLDEIEAKLHLTVEPTIKLAQYKGLSVEKELVVVLDDEVDEKVKKLQEDNAELVVKENSTVENGDVVIIDFEGFVDDVAFEGGKASKYQLEVGSNTFIPGFEEQLIGMKTNEDKDIKVTFPKEYAPHLASKKAVFKIHLHEVKEKKLPEINDDLALDANLDDVSTLEELKEHYRKDLFKKKENDAKNAALGKVFELIIKNSEVEIAPSIIEKEKDLAIANVKQDLEQQNMKFEDYLKTLKLTEKEFEEKVKEEAKRNITFAYVVMSIAKEEKIEVTDKELDDTLSNVAKMYGQKLEDFKKALKDRLFGLKQEMLYNKVYEFLKKENNLV